MHERSPLVFPSVRRATNTAAALPPSFHDSFTRSSQRAHLSACTGSPRKRVSYLEPELLDAKPTSVGRAIPHRDHMVLDDKGARWSPARPASFTYGARM